MYLCLLFLGKSTYKPNFFLKKQLYFNFLTKLFFYD